jgi:SOS response regulatory protein OraA/RecX
MHVTDLERLTRHIYALQLDGLYAANIDIEVLSKHRIKVGADVWNEELFELKEESKRSRAFRKGLDLLKCKSFTRAQMIDKLVNFLGSLNDLEISRDFLNKKDQFKNAVSGFKSASNEEVADEVVERLKEIRMIDDVAYAKNYAQELFENKFLAAERVMQELLIRGISVDVVCNMIDDVIPEPTGQIFKFLKKKYPDWGKDFKVERRAIEALERLGYDWEVIEESLRKFKDDFA